MQTCRFYVKVRDKKDIGEFFPYLKPGYLNTTKNFTKGKVYPVLAVKESTVFDDDESAIDSAQFLVPTENDNFLWVQSEIFTFVGLEKPAN